MLTMLVMGSGKSLENRRCASRSKSLIWHSIKLETYASLSSKFASHESLLSWCDVHTYNRLQW